MTLSGCFSSSAVVFFTGAFVPYSPRGNMFNEDEDWNDEQDAQVVNKTVLKTTQKATSSTNVKVNVLSGQ